MKKLKLFLAGYSIVILGIIGWMVFKNSQTISCQDIPDALRILNIELEEAVVAGDWQLGAEKAELIKEIKKQQEKCK